MISRYRYYSASCFYFVHGAALEPVLASSNEFYAIGKDHADNPYLA